MYHLLTPRPALRSALSRRESECVTCAVRVAWLGRLAAYTHAIIARVFIRSNIVCFSSACATLRSSTTGAVGVTWRCLLRACWSVAQALAHDRTGDATGAEGVGDPQERAMPKLHRRQATWAAYVSI